MFQRLRAEVMHEPKQIADLFLRLAGLELADVEADRVVRAAADLQSQLESIAILLAKLAKLSCLYR